MDLDLDNPREAGARSVCAVLRCVEESQPPNIPTTSQDQNQAPVRNISSLTIFKTSRTTSGDKGSKALGVVVASLTPQQPRMTSVSNGIKTDGVLDNNRASLTLEMVKSVDCLADFACQVRSVDANGAESVSVSRVHQSKGRSRGDSQTMVASVSLQILDLVHELDTRSTIVAKSTEKIENKVETFENNLNGKVETLKNKVETLENNLNSQVKSLEDKLSVLQNRIEDKMEDGIEDKLFDIHMNVAAFTKKAESFSDDVRESLNRSLNALSQTVTREQKDALDNLDSAARYLLDNQSNVTDALVLTTRNLTHTQTALQNKLLENLATAVDGISESSVNISKTLTDDFASLEQQLQGTFQQLASNVNHSATETLTAASNLFFRTNLTAAAAIKDLLYLKECKRGSDAVLSYPLFPYPVVQPSAESILNVPYLCDTVTETGGWIVIQRRTTGDVDFYRGWEKYKAGFGNLKGDFWLGLEHTHKITSSGQYELRIDMEFKGKSYYARYGHFSVANEANGYALSVGDYRGPAPDSLNYHNGQKFTTPDRDNDSHSSGHCAEYRGGSWWFKSCARSNLNGRWKGSHPKTVFWSGISGRENLSYTEMKIRRVA